MFLFIDSSGQSVTKLALCDNATCHLSEIDTLKNHLENLLPAIDSLLRSQSCSLSDLRLIAVHSGPGSYTGLRVSITIANTLAWSLDIPIIATHENDPSALIQLATSEVSRNPHFQSPVVPAYPSNK